MKIKINLYTILFGASFVAIALVNLLVFMFIDKEALGYTAFWLGWGLTTPVVLLVSGGVTLVINHIAKKDFVTNAGLAYLNGVFSLIFLGSGLLLELIYKLDNKIAIALFAILIVAYVVVMPVFVYCVYYMQKNRQTIKRKVFYIRDLAGVLESVAIKINDADVKKKVLHLQESIRFSDPMSDDSLEDIELKISGCVDEIVRNINANEYAKVIEIVEEAEVCVLKRNARVRALK